jgi:transcription elongation GreA/GreB family factor
MDQRSIKQQLYKNCQEQLHARLQQLETRFADLDRALAQETKSSVGDKYETGRAMIHLERNKLQQQKAVVLQQQQQLAAINTQQVTPVVEMGSVVVTNEQAFYLSIGLGKLLVDNKAYYALTGASPVGRLLLGKKAGEAFEFRGKRYQLLAVF